MRIAHVFNNNVVLVTDADGRESILTGRGLGFQAKPGQQVDDQRVVRRFVPAEGQDAGRLGELLADIPPEHIALADGALGIARAQLGEGLAPGVLVSFADHLSFAVKRARLGIVVEYPLRAEVAHLYPRELAIAEAMVAHVNDRLEDVQLPAAEAVAITLHLVNAGFSTGDLSATYQMTGVFNQIFEVIHQAYGRDFDTSSVSAARFVTHLRYFFIRAHTGKQFTDDTAALATVFQTGHPHAYQTALKLKALLELRLGMPINESETVYLTMHVSRLAAEGA